jgi:hypothetical protein
MKFKKCGWRDIITLIFALAICVFILLLVELFHSELCDLNDPSPSSRCRLVNETYNISVVHSYYGYYYGGKIWLKTDKVNSTEEFLFIALHEWGHQVMDKQMTSADMKLWIAAVNKCGYQSRYANSYQRKSLKVMEEWAEDFAGRYMGNTYCAEKMVVLNKYK